MATDFGKNLRHDLYSTRWHFETDSIIAISMQKYSKAVLSLHYILCKFDQDWSTNTREIANWAAIWRSSFLLPGVQKWIGISQFWFQQVNRQSFLYTVKIWWDSDQWPQSFRRKKLNSRHRKCYYFKICEMTFIQHASVSKWIRLSQFRFKKIQWQYFVYILCKFDQDWYSNPIDYEGKNYNFLDKTAKSAFCTKYLSMYRIDRNHKFRVGRQLYADYKIEISFAIIEGMLLW